MARPRKDTSDAWYDVFMSWPLADQAIALKVLEQTHRQAIKIAAMKIVAEASQSSLLDGTETETGTPQ